MKKRSLVFFLIMAMVAGLLTGCGSKAKNPNESSNENSVTPAEDSTVTNDSTGQIGEVDAAAESVDADELVLSCGYDIADLSPWSAASNGRNSILPSIYEYMAYYDSDSESGMAGILMKDFKKVDNLTYQVTIYDYIYDSAGNQLTAEDVAWCFNTWKELGLSVKCKLLDSCTVIDDYTVEIKMTQDTVGDVQNMMCGLIPIVTKAGYEQSGDEMNENVISTAHYKVTDYVSGSQLVLERNDNYWQKDESLMQEVQKANAKKITFKILTETSQVAINLETDVIDIAPQLSYTEASRFENGKTQGYKVYSVTDPNINFITFNQSVGGVFENNLALRQAICYAIDAQGLLDGVLKGKGIVLYAYGSPQCIDYNSEWDNNNRYAYDTEKAKELLAESGFDTSTRIRIMTINNENFKKAAQLIQAYLLQIGVNSDILAYENALFNTYQNDSTQWDINLTQKQSADYVTSLSNTWIAVGANATVGFVNDKKLTEMATNVATTAGHTSENIDEYMNYILDQCFMYPLYSNNNYYVTEDTITSIFVNFKGYLVPGASTFSADFNR